MAALGPTVAAVGALGGAMGASRQGIYRRLGGESNREIVFVSFVRACERSCVWPRDDVASEAGLRKLEKSCGVAWRGVAWRGRALRLAVTKPLPCLALTC